MSQKETRTLNPTHDEVMQVLGGIEEATAGEPLREKWGELGNLKDDPRRETKEVGSDSVLAGYFKRWREDHISQKPEYKYIDPDKAIIEDLTGLEIPFDFMDDLITRASKALEARGKEVKMFNNIRKFVIVIFVKPYKGFRVMIKANNEIAGAHTELSILSFRAEPPFDLKEIKSTYSNYTF